MQTAVSILCTVYVGATVVIGFATALEAGDDGVCSKTETYRTSQSETFEASFIQSFETCDWLFFCKTKYRTAYRSETRTVYRTRSRDYLTCCIGYVEVEGSCKPKVRPTAAPTTPTTQSMPSSTLRTTVHTTLPTFPADATTLPPEMATALPGVMSLQTMMMISGAGVLLVVVAVTALLLVFVVARRRRRKRQLASSLENTEGNGEFIQPHGAYYSIIRSTGPGTDGTDANAATVHITGLPDQSSSGPPTPARAKKNTFKNLSLFYAKIIKGRGKERDSDVQSYDSRDSHATDDDDDDRVDIVHYYSDMNSVGSTPTRQPQGYIDMSSPVRARPAASSAVAKDAPAEGNEYSTMDSPAGSDGEERYNEFEPYDKINKPDKPPIAKVSPDPNGYDHLERSDRSHQTDTTKPSEEIKPVGDNPYDNPYDVVGKGATEERGHGPGDQGKDPEPYDHLKGSVMVENGTRKGGENQRKDLQEDIPPKQDGSVYYNTPEENALKRRTKNDDENIYTNVS